MLDYTRFQRMRHKLSRVPLLKHCYDLAKLVSSPSYFEDGLWTFHNFDFVENEDFKRAYLAGEHQDHGFEIRWRMTVLFWAARAAAGPPRGFFECGGKRGVFSEG